MLLWSQIAKRSCYFKALQGILWRSPQRIPAASSVITQQRNASRDLQPTSARKPKSQQQSASPASLRQVKNQRDELLQAVRNLVKDCNADGGTARKDAMKLLRDAELWEKIDEKVSFSAVKYEDISELDQLSPKLAMGDITEFPLKQAHFSFALSSLVFNDLQHAIYMFGPPNIAHIEEPRSRLIGALFSGMLSKFKFQMRNDAEPIFGGRLARGGRIEHRFCAFRFMSLVFVEVKQQLQPETPGYLDAVAQLIVEADACCYQNRLKGSRQLVHGILTDAQSFQFFRFNDDDAKPFQLGVQDGENLFDIGKFPRMTHRNISGLYSWARSYQFVAETIFYILLKGFEDAMNSPYVTANVPSVSDEDWAESRRLIKEVLALAVEAHEVAERGDRDEAEEMAKKAEELLEKCVDAVPGAWQGLDVSFYQTLKEHGYFEKSRRDHCVLPAGDV